MIVRPPSPPAAAAGDGAAAGSTEAWAPEPERAGAGGGGRIWAERRPRRRFAVGLWVAMARFSEESTKTPRLQTPGCGGELPWPEYILLDSHRGLKITLSSTHLLPKRITVPDLHVDLLTSL